MIPKIEVTIEDGQSLLFEKFEDLKSWYRLRRNGERLIVGMWKDNGDKIEFVTYVGSFVERVLKEINDE